MNQIPTKHQTSYNIIHETEQKHVKQRYKKHIIYSSTLVLTSHIHGPRNQCHLQSPINGTSGSPETIKKWEANLKATSLERERNKLKFSKKKIYVP
jgi:uncharacterized protein (UPF0305 family)